MSPEANKEVVRRFYEEVVSTGDVERLPELVAEGYVEVVDGVRHPAGLGGARAHVVGVRETYPDLQLRVQRQIAEGQWVVSEVVARGTHAGAWMGIRPTGRPVRFFAVNVDRVVDGRIVEHGGAANLLGPLLEIGAVRAVGP